MASWIKGITVEIGGDTSGLERVLSDVNNFIKKTQSQLRDVNNLLKLDPSNTVLLAQKQELFGMVRCIGTAPKQVMRLVRKEALNWCRFAILLGVAGGIVLVWVLCFILRQLSPEFFGGMPAFSISYPSVIAGIVVGLLTVLLAARSPAKKASKVSPLAAVSGNANDLQPVKKAANTKFFKIETSLGIHHAKASKKNFILISKRKVKSTAF